MNAAPWPEVMMTIIREEQLANGLQIRFVDESNRYFGDYHRVCVVATIICKVAELPVGNAEDEAFRDKALGVLGAELCVIKRFERMGVATAELDEVRTALVDDFLRSALPYLSRPGYPRSLMNSQMTKRPIHRSYV